MLGVVAQSLAEITVLAEKGGISRADFLAFLNDSVMGSMFTRYKTPALVNLDFTPTFTPKLLLRTSTSGFEAARGLNVPMPVAAAAAEIVRAMQGAGYEDVDFAALLEIEARGSGLDLEPEDVDGLRRPRAAGGQRAGGRLRAGPRRPRGPEPGAARAGAGRPPRTRAARSPGSARTTSRGSGATASRAGRGASRRGGTRGTSCWARSIALELPLVRGGEVAVAHQRLGDAQVALDDRAQLAAAGDPEVERRADALGGQRQAVARPSRPRRRRRPRWRRAGGGGSSCPGSGPGRARRSSASITVVSLTWKRGSKEPTPMRSSSPAGKLQP